MRVDSLDLPVRLKEFLVEQGIERLYPPQELAVRKGVLNGKSVVVSAPTASGKTLIAELVAMKHVLELGGKVLYLTPLRALASEKYEVFGKYKELGVRGRDEHGRLRLGRSLVGEVRRDNHD